MATITDTAGTNSQTGTSSSDTINGLGGNDTARGQGGNDTIRGGDGDDSLMGGANNDVIYGEAGNDVILGETGSDLLLDGGEGNDSVTGGDGDDTLSVEIGEGTDTLDGGAGIDSLTIEVTSAQLTAGARADFEALSSWIGSPSGTLVLSSLGLTLSGIESLNILLDGQSVDISELRDSAPIAEENFILAFEDETASSQLLASDPDGGAVTWSLLEGPSEGMLQLDADGNYTYLGQDGFSGSDSFVVRITDSAGLTLDQTVEVWVTPVADEPVLMIGGGAVTLGGTQDGTADDDVLSGDLGSDMISGGAGDDLIVGDSEDVRLVGLDMSAFSADPDGSETVTIRISGLPEGAMLMAGIQEADGSWTLDPSELEGLILATSETSDFTIEVEASAVETAGEGDVGVTSASLFVAFESGDGSDELDGGAGSDTILGGAGDDLILEVVDGSSNVISGDAGIDTLLLSMSSEQVTDDVRADLAALLAWMDGLEPELETEDGIDLAALGLSMSGVEQVFAVVDGIATDIASLLETSGPEAEPVVGVETMEDAAVSGQLEASDADGDALAWSVLEGPANGTLQLDASGAYTYTAHADFSGSDLFMVEVSDDDGNTAMQLVEVTIAAVADAPSLQVSVSAAAAAAGVPSTAGTAADDTLTGTAGADEIAAGDGNDLVRGDSAGSAGPLALQIVAALGDLDGSEALSIRVEGIPDDATLSAGVRHDDGSWSLEPADLAGLTLTAPDGSAFTLSVAATATESTGEKATATVELAVSVGGGALGAGNDTLRGQDGNDTIYGGGGDDLVRGGWGSDSLHDEAGNDHVHGGMGSDRITNGEGNDVVWAGQSNDTIRDGAGDDVMHGDDGNDLFVVGSGNDRYHGGDGFDTIDLSAVGVGLRIDTPARSVTGNGAETWRVEGIERFVGTAFADTFLGGHARNVFEAGGGDDTIRGGQGDDKLTGGAGRDTFSWIKDDVRNGSTDIITDFAQGDRLNIKSVLQGLTYTSLNNVVRVVDNSWGTMVSVKVDGKMHEMAKLEGFHATSATQMLAAEMILV